MGMGVLIYSNRIIESAKIIDRSLIETKGATFVKRMQQSLPRLPEARSKIEEGNVEGKSEEAIIKTCSWTAFVPTV